MKKLKVLLCIVVILCAVPCFLSAQSNPKIRNFLVYDDLDGLVECYNECVGERSEIEDAFDCFVDWQSMTYEQVLDLNSHMKSDNTPLNTLLKKVLKQKEISIVEEALELTAEQLYVYLANYPKRNEVIEAYIDNVFTLCLDSLPYNDFLYLQANLKDNRLLNEQANKRKEEGQAYVKKAVGTYCKLENYYTNRLLFVLKYRAWQYLVSRHKSVVKYYSNVGIVADSPHGISSQYEGIIQSCFSADDLNRQLTKDVTAFVKAINNARAHYVALAGLKDDFPRAVINLPSIGSFPIRSNMKIVNRIPEARKDFISSRQTVGSIANVANWLGVSTLLTCFVKGGFDIYAVNELANKEYSARREYILDMCRQLKRIFRDYYKIIDKSILKQTSDNQKIFSNYVKQH